MQMYREERHFGPTATAARADLAPGVAQFMNGVYGWMAAGVGVTAVTVGVVGSSPTALALLFGTPLLWVVMFAPLLMVLLVGGRLHRMDPKTAIATFLAFSAVMGLSLAPLGWKAAENPSLFMGTFGVAAAMFAALAVFGWTTKKDLTGMGQFFLMALFGMIIASVVNVFVQSVEVSFGLSALGVLVFAGLTAYDTQKIKQSYLMHGAAGNLAILGALELYLDFINLFLSLLRLFGGSSRD